MLLWKPFVNMFKNPDKQKDTNYALSQGLMNKLLNQQAWIGENAFNFGFDTLKETKGDVNYLQDFFQKIMEGGDNEQLLDFIDAEGLDASYANAEATANELTPRGGMRASALGNLNFQKAGDIQKLLQGVRAKSPDALMQLAQILGSLSGGALNTSANAFNLEAGLIGGNIQRKETEAERKNRLIAGLISAGGSIAGAAMPT